MKLSFTKMHGLGNDFVVVPGPVRISSKKIAKICDRHFGIGADGLLVVTPINKKLVKMKYWNADGSPAEMCGNGLRCVAKFAVDSKLVKAGEFTVHTDAGALQAVWDGKNAKNIEVQVGQVSLSPEPVKLFNKVFYSADVGNPHAVTFVGNVKNFPVDSVGPAVEADKIYPGKTNVEFVQVVSPHKIKLRVWERGVGETLACGTGMVAATTAAVVLKNGRFPMQVEVAGGKATVRVDTDGYSRIIGPAVTVFSGTLDI